jgi:hypothetical protein
VGTLRFAHPATRNDLLVSRISAVTSLLEVLSPAETKQLGTLIRELLARQDISEMDRFTICRMCDDRLCELSIAHNQGQTQSLAPSRCHVP